MQKQGELPKLYNNIIYNFTALWHTMSAEGLKSFETSPTRFFYQANNKEIISVIFFHKHFV